MMRQATRIAVAVAFATSIAQGASAQLIAGWDFSQVAADGVAVTSLSANYTTAGTSGTVTTSGDVVASAMAPATNPTNAPGIQGGVASLASIPGELREFNNFAVLRNGGQGTTEFLGLTARNAATISFNANAGVARTGWRLTFGGRAIADPSDPSSDGVSVVDVSFGSTCGATSPVGSVNLTQTDQTFALSLNGQASTATGCVVFGVDGTSDQPLIDNVAVPEPGFGSMLVAGAMSLFGLARGRRV